MEIVELSLNDQSNIFDNFVKIQGEEQELESLIEKFRKWSLVDRIFEPPQFKSSVNGEKVQITNSYLREVKFRAEGHVIDAIVNYVNLKTC